MRQPACLPYVLVVVALAGCGSGRPRELSADTKGQELLGEVGELYRIYSFEKKAPPKRKADFASLSGAQPVGYNAINDGQIVLLYGGVMAETEEGPVKGDSDEVLAYEKQVPESGGQVLMLNRAVKKMTAEEFKAAKKSGKN